MKTKVKIKISGIGVTFVLSAVAKLLGALYRIPLIRIIGAKAMGDFSLAFPIYAFAVTLVGSGITVSVARLMLSGEYSHEGILKKAGLIFGALSVLVASLMCMFSNFFFFLTTAEEISPVLIIMMVSLPFSTLSAVLRGYFQGKNQTVITGVSYCVEPIIKTVIGLSLAPFLSLYGVALAVSVSEVCTTLFLFVIYFSKEKQNEGKIPSTKVLLAPILKTAVGSAILPLSQFFDGVIVLRILSATIGGESGRELLGILSSINSLLSLPSLAVSALLSSALCRFCDDKKRGKALRGYLFGIYLLTSVFSASAFVFAPTIVKTLYPTFSFYQTQRAISLIKILAPYPLFFALKSVFGVYLQGVGKFFLPSLSIAVGVVTKMIIEIMLTSSLSIYASALGILLANGVSLLINAVAVVRSKTFLLKNNKLLPIVLSPLIFVVVANAFNYYSRSIFVCIVAFSIALLSIGLYLYAFVFLPAKNDEMGKDGKDEANERYITLKSSKSG